MTDGWVDEWGGELEKIASWLNQGRKVGKGVPSDTSETGTVSYQIHNYFKTGSFALSFRRCPEDPFERNGPFTLSVVCYLW